MLIDLVATNGSRLLAENDETPLGAVRLALRATFVDRRFYLQQMFGQLDPREQWPAEASNSRWFRAVRAEAPTLREFLRSVRFFGAPDEDAVCSETFFLWVVLEMIANTRAHGGHQTRRMFYVDSSSLHVNEDRILDFYRPNQQLMNPDFIARHALVLFEEVLHAAEIMERMCVDETERAAITIVCLINKLRRAGTRVPQAAEWLDRTFRYLRTYYEQTSRLLSTRLGQLLLCHS
ncbi:hypothetical protein M3Y99_01324500 [Aphelenchoides fujianensis]|nr:hypothetical protein M3Y99_01324500 [Aphelenchoides fujianensis]